MHIYKLECRAFLLGYHRYLPSDRDMNNRRKLAVSLVVSALAPSFTALAQMPANLTERRWRVGFLIPRRRPGSIDADFIGGFPEGMREHGYIEGKNLAIEWRFADGDLARLPDLAIELAQLKVDVIVAAGPQAIRAAQKASSTIPIVMAVPGDVIGEGFVVSLARPGGNITGATVLAGDIVAKRLQLLLEMSPKLTRVALLMNPDVINHVEGLASLQTAAKRTKAKILPAEARTSEEIEGAFDRMVRDKADAVIIIPDAIFNSHVRQIANFASKLHLPVISGAREYVHAGCLMSYSASFRDNFRRAAYYVDRIFKGTKPAALPVEQPIKFELYINGKTAKTLGLTIPHSLLISADKVIE